MFTSRGLKTIGKCAIGLVAALGTFLGACWGQSQTAPARYMVKNLVFHLPFKMDTANADLREIELWVRDTSGRWKVMDRVTPTAKQFTCQVAKDGEYGFSIVMVDRSGKANPADVTLRAPELLVQVDTKGKQPMISDLGSTPANSKPPSTLKFSGNQPVPELQDTQEAPPVLSWQETQAPPDGKLPNYSAEALHEAVLQHDAGTSESSTDRTPSVMTPSITKSQADKVLLVNSTHVSIDYNIKKAGPSGVSKVEIYLTRDGGKTWQRQAVDSAQHSPVAVHLPGEGVFGIRIVGINGNGFGGKKPGPGDSPATVVEVDMTKPVIPSWKVTPGKDGNLEIQWKVSDKNLGPEPINIYYRTKANDPWKPMALKVKNDGVFHWAISKDPASQYFVRLEAIDRAGNSATCETPYPIAVDRTEPDIRVQGVTVIRTAAEEPGILVPGETTPEN